MITVETNKGQECNFWLARVGECVGKPLREPYTSTNSFAVHSTDPENDFAKLFCIYQSGIWRMYAHGTCQAAVRIKEVRTVARMMVDVPLATATKVAQTLAYADALEAQLAKARQLAKALAYSAVKVK